MLKNLLRCLVKLLAHKASVQLNWYVLMAWSRCASLFRLRLHTVIFMERKFKIYLKQLFIAACNNNNEPNVVFEHSSMECCACVCSVHQSIPTKPMSSCDRLIEIHSFIGFQP